ncbi:MAG: type I methionyl aminopeptidase [Candidatus Zixiibacteriota bacterium]|nr:MAG: type I methionyl aminopeptidase [candidate division Zixibacteria bacterium]
MIILKNPQEIDRIRTACGILRDVFLEVAPLMVPGTRAADIDRRVEEAIRRRGGRPAFKGIVGAEGIPFPASVCLSVDDEVVHGIPGDRVLTSGQIVGLDIGVEWQGYYGDAARTYLIGEVPEPVRRLVEITRECLDRGLEQARKGRRLGDISHAIQEHAERHGYSVVRELSGHGIGRTLWEDPQVPNYGLPGKGPKLLPGMTMAVEPMINLGARDVLTLDDHWTIVTADGLPSAHWEDTIVVTGGDPLILTR